MVRVRQGRSWRKVSPLPASNTLHRSFIVYRRAGLPVGSDALRTLLSVILNSPVVSIFGFYSHAGDSYASTTPEKASSFLTVEMRAVNSAAMMALSMMSQMSDKSQRTKHRSPFILSVGSTRTAHNVPSTDSPAAVIARGMN